MRRREAPDTNSYLEQVTHHCHAAMPTFAPEKVIASDLEQLNMRVPSGFKEKLEELRRVTGHRSMRATLVSEFQKLFEARGI
jgi:hypothetical protein